MTLSPWPIPMRISGRTVQRQTMLIKATDFGRELLHPLTADAALDEFIEKYHPGWDYQVALIYAFRDEVDPAFDWLDKAYDNRDTGRPLMLLNPLLSTQYGSSTQLNDCDHEVMS